MRLSYAITEMSHHNEYKFVLINENINETVKNLIKIIDYHIFVNSNKLKIEKKLNIMK